MYHGMDVAAIDEAPRRDENPGYALFFLFWIFIEAFCVKKLIVGVVVANFKKMKEQEHEGFMTIGQREWVDTIMRSTRLKVSVQPPRPSYTLGPYLSPRVSLFAPTETCGSTAGLLL